MRKILEIVAILMIGEGLLSAIRPEGHVALWRNGPQGYRDLMDKFMENPGLTRALGVAELGLGLWLAFREQP